MTDTRGTPITGQRVQSLEELSAKSSRFDPVLTAAFVAICIVIVPLLVPERLRDRGIFVSVAERLLAGDALYSGVYDNKDPLFYYFTMAQLSLGPWAEVAAEAMLIAIVSSAAYSIAILETSRWTAAAISLVSIPIIVTGAFYLPGYTHLPAISLILAASAACAHGRPGLAGACIGVLLFTKLILLPVGLAAVGCFLLSRSCLSEARTFAIVILATTFVLVGILLVRSEFWPFVEMLRLNVAYSQGALVGEATGLASLAAHINKIIEGVPASMIARFVAEVVSIALTIMLTLILLSSVQQRSAVRLAITASCILTFLASLLVLSLTGLWMHHCQILYIPAIFAVLAMAPVLDLTVKRARLPTIASIGLIILSAYILAGIPSPAARYIRSATAFTRSYAALGELSPEAERLLATGNSGTYARIGTNDELGHAYGLGNWRLACPRFHQYEFDPAAVLDTVFDCASNAPTLIIGANFGREPYPVRRTWNDFVRRVEHMLAESYSCDASSGLRICKRIRSPQP